MRTCGEKKVGVNAGLGRRRFLLSGLLTAVAPGLSAKAIMPSALDALRIWPAEEYTRIILEYRNAVEYNFFQLNDPERLVLDLKNVDKASVAKHVEKMRYDQDPHVKLIRVGQYDSTTVRVVIEAREAIKAEVFLLEPVAEYGHRVVTDLYPKNGKDPLSALIALDGSDNEPEMTDDDAVLSLLAESDKTISNTPAVGTTVKEKPPKITAKPPVKKPARTRPFIVAIDPGHGGEDPGAVSRNKRTYEKTITLAIAKKLAKKISKAQGMRAMLTRTGDYYVSLRGRVLKARNARADLFISIHADAFPDPRARGASVFILSSRGASSSAARWLARKENQADLVGGVNIGVQDKNLAKTLLDLSLSATLADSEKLAKQVLRNIGKIGRLHKRSVEKAGFAVLKAPDIPSILIETAFISNPQEEKRLRSSRFQESMADSVLQAIWRYVETNGVRHGVVLAKQN